MINIVYITNDTPFFISHRLQLAKDAVNQGYIVHLLAPLIDRSKIISNENISLHDLKINRKKTRFFTSVLGLFKIRKTIKQISPDIIHCISLKNIVFLNLACFGLKKHKVLNTFTGLGFLYEYNKVAVRLKRIIIERVLKITIKVNNSVNIFQNQHDMDVLISKKIIKQENTFIIESSGVDIHKFVPSSSPTRSNIILLASRMLWDKGISEFASAAKMLKIKYPDVRFVLAGGIDNQNPMAIPESQLKKWVEENDIEWLGHQEDVKSLMHNAMIVCLPSYHEGAPKVLLEAAACAKPIVCTDIPGCKVIVEDNVNGFLVKKKNIPSLIAALSKLIDNPDLRIKFANAAREKAVKNFSYEKINNRYLSLYKEYEP